MELKKKQTKRLVLNQSFVSQNATFWLNDNIFNFGTQLKSEGLHFGLQLSMAVCYNKLWKLLIDKSMNKTQLREAAKIGTATLSRLNKNEHVSMEVIEKICAVLNCQASDIIEFKEDTQP